MFLAPDFIGNHLPIGDSPESGQARQVDGSRFMVPFFSVVVMLRRPRKGTTAAVRCVNARVPAASSLAGGAVYFVEH
jgi:hypothetical protein